MSLIISCKQSGKDWFTFAKEALFNQWDCNNSVFIKFYQSVGKLNSYKNSIKLIVFLPFTFILFIYER